MSESSELAERPQSRLAERTAGLVDIRRVLELRATLQVQDDILLLDAARAGYLDDVGKSIRISPTPEVDPQDGAPIFVSVGSEPTPDSVVAGMTGKTFVVRHRPVTGPAPIHSLSGSERPALPSGATTASE